MENKALSVLIVEDDFDMEPLWNEIFREIDPNAQVTWTANIGEAESLIDSCLLKKAYDLIISDVFVSGSRTGVDLLDRYRSSISGRILIVSGADERLLERYLGDHYSTVKILGKPFTKVEGIRAVQAVLKSAKNAHKGTTGLYHDFWR
ncbi:MAG: response regulator [Bdellovibrionaceae bacterium]|nr:response regulator [Pseudobdellovibrionaceae bacterium]